MNKKLLLSTTAIAAIGIVKMAPAIADSSNFQGPFISAGASFDQHTTDVKNNESNIPATVANTSSALAISTFTGFETSASTILGRAASSFSNDDDNVAAEISAGYNFAVNDKFLLGLDLSYNTGGHSTSKANDYTQSTVAAGDGSNLSFSIVQAAGTQTTTFEEDETYSVGIRPSFAINDKAMVYSRLSYGQTKATLKTKYSLAADSTAEKSVSEDLDSYGFGLGAIYNFNENAFLDISANYKKSDKIINKIDDSNQTAALDSLVLTSATDTLTTTAENETYGITLKVGTRF